MTVRLFVENLLISMPCFVIAEAGVNHNGKVSLALALIDAAREAGVDAVKFQTFRAEKLVSQGTPKAAYQRQQTGAGDQHSMLKALELSPQAHEQLANRCRETGIEFMSTPFDRESADFLVGLGMQRIKVASGELTNHPFLAHLAGYDLPLIVSTGMANLKEVAEAVAVIGKVRAANGSSMPLSNYLTLLHCTSNYPADPADANLRAMHTMASHCSLPVGYSDHSLGTAVSVAAVALGATVIEKHLTLDRELDGPDHRASLDPSEFARLVADIRAAEQALGSGIKEPTENELPVRDLVRRSITLARDVPAGRELKVEDFDILRPGTGIPPSELSRVIGARASTNLSAGSLLAWSDVTE